MKHYAIADCHGHNAALKALLLKLKPKPTDTITFLGDYIDSGPDSKGVIDTIWHLSNHCNVRCVKGNHESLFLAALHNEEIANYWLSCGGHATLDSFSARNVREVPDQYVQWIAALADYICDDNNIFVHAGLNSEVDLDKQSEEDLMWKFSELHLPHVSGKRVIAGHQVRIEPVMTAHYVGLDTGIASGGYLSCLDVDSGVITRADRFGEISTISSGLGHSEAAHKT